MNKKLVYATLAFIALLAVGLPYGMFTWNTNAQTYGGSGEAAPPAGNVVNYDGKSISFFVEDGQLAVYGECLATDGQCSRVALVNFNEVESGETIYDGDVVIRVYEISDGVWQLNVYSNGVLIDDKTLVYVDADGAVLFITRN